MQKQNYLGKLKSIDPTNLNTTQIQMLESMVKVEKLKYKYRRKQHTVRLSCDHLIEE